MALEPYCFVMHQDSVDFGQTMKDNLMVVVWERINPKLLLNSGRNIYTSPRYGKKWQSVMRKALSSHCLLGC